MGAYLGAYAFTAIAFLCIDLVWLVWVARRFYADNLGALLLKRPRFGAAVLFYALYVLGIVYFAVSPALRDGSMAVAAFNGALFGFVAYATYEMTNYATLRNWPRRVAVVDLAWGACVTCISACAGYLATLALIGV